MPGIRKPSLHDAQGLPAESLGDRRLALRALDAGSFSAAARSTGVDVSTVSRAVERLEASLGARLFARSARGLVTTEAGQRYLAHTREWLAHEDALRAELTSVAQGRTGRLRVTVPVVLASRILPGALERFAAAHPHVRVDVIATDQTVDLTRQGVDLAVRMGPLPSSSLKTRRIARFRRVLCGSPALAKERAELRSPTDLADHPCLVYGGSAGPIRWTFVGPRGRRAEVEVEGPVRANDSMLVVRLAERGLGFARIPEMLAAEALRAGRLVTLLPAWRCDGAGGEPTLEAVWPEDPSRNGVRRAFLSHLEAAIRELDAPGVATR